MPVARRPEQSPEPDPHQHNLVETADLMGVGVHTLQAGFEGRRTPCPTSGMDDGSSSPTPPSSDGWRRRQTGTPWGHTSSSGRKSEENHIKRSAAPPGAGTAAVQK